MLKRRALNATVWSGIDLLARQGVQFLCTLVLARLLTPADFGVIAMLAFFSGLAAVLMDGGFSAALIQRQDVDHADESTAFWCNLGLGALLALGLCIAAPVIADFYRLPILAPLTRVMALAVLFGALGAIHSTLLTKRLDFRTQAKAGLIAAMLSGVVAVLMALLGYGVWSLVAQVVIMAGTTSALLWLLHPWRPQFVFSGASVRKLFSFGGYHLGSSLLEVVYTRLYAVLIGRMFGARDLGYYHNAETTKQMPIAFFGGVFARVALPMFSTTAQDPQLLRRGMQLSIRGTMLLQAPVLLGIAALAEPLVLLLFGSQWLPAAPILRVLCLSGVLYPLHSINLHALMAQGHSGLMFRLEVAKKALGVALILAGAAYGVMGIAWSQAVFSLLALGINAHYTRRLLGYGAGAQLREVGPTLLAAGAMSAVVYGLSGYWSASSVIEVLLLVPVGAALYLGLVWGARLDAFDDVVLLVRAGAQTSKVNSGSRMPQ